MDDWIAQQADTEASSWETSIARFYPQHADVWTDPAKQVHAVTHEWNFLDALEFVPWRALMRGRELRVLDLAAGTGWLSAYLSRFDEIATIDTQQILELARARAEPLSREPSWRRRPSSQASSEELRGRPALPPSPV